MQHRNAIALLAIAIVIMAVLSQCNGRRECSDNPPFYLKGTAADCAAVETAEKK